MPKRPASRTIHPIFVRITHWINAGAIVILIGSGLQIYNAAPIFGFGFPDWLTIGGWLGGAIQWHFAAMWLLMANFAAMVLYGLISRRYYRKLWPIRLREIRADIRDALALKLRHLDPSRYNAVQKILYAGVLLAILLAILSGFAIWKPVQLQSLTWLLGGFQGARLVHFLAMAAISGFILLHVFMALLVPKTLLAMIRGR